MNWRNHRIWTKQILTLADKKRKIKNELERKTNIVAQANNNLKLKMTKVEFTKHGFWMKPQLKHKLKTKLIDLKGKKWYYQPHFNSHVSRSKFYATKRKAIILINFISKIISARKKQNNI